MELKVFVSTDLCSIDLSSNCTKIRLSEKTVFYPLSPIQLLYLCFASQRVLLGFYRDSSLFTFPVTSIHAGACDDRHCERESAHGGST